MAEPVTLLVDDDEMAEILADDEDLKKGLDDVEKGRYRMINDTDYLNAIPGMAEKLIASYNAPASEFSPMPDDWINRNV